METVEAMDPLNEVDEDQPNKRQRLCSTNNDNDGQSNANANDNTNHHIPIRTVYVCFPGAKADQVKSYFERFGEIESVSMRLEGCYKRRYLVQFKRKEDAAEALQCTENRKYDITVKPAGPWHQPDHPINKPPECESNIVSTLNDHCIQEIFQHLELIPDLINVAGVCVRFNQHVKTAFTSKHKHLDIGDESLVRQGLLETAIKHFGKDTQSLRIPPGYFTRKDALSLFSQNFGSKLKQIEILGCGFETDSQSLRPIFAGIEQLKLVKFVSSIGLSELMAGCVELKSLTLKLECGSRPQDYSLMKQTFPKLHELLLDSNTVNDEMFESFVSRHPTLIKLSIEDTPITPSVFRTIGQHARNLQELKYVGNGRPSNYNDGQIRNDAAFIGQLTSLKKLHTDLDPVPLLAMMNALVASAIPIESLEVCLFGDSIRDDAMKCIWQLKQIKFLRLTTNRTTHHEMDADIIGLAKNLPELEELVVEHCVRASLLSTIGLRKMLVHATKLKLLKVRWIDSIHIAIDDYKAMLSTVQKRKEKVPLVIEIHGEANQVDVPATVLAENHKTLNVKVIR